LLEGKGEGREREGEEREEGRKGRGSYQENLDFTRKKIFPVSASMMQASPFSRSTYLGGMRREEGETGWEGKGGGGRRRRRESR
jgi:hypothetical protein